jgi:hypothetical protein
MSNTPRFVFGIMVFVFFLSVFLADLTGTTFNLLSPITLTLVSIPLVAVIAASNTPIVKGAAMASFFGIVGVYFYFSTVPIAIYGVLIVPMFIAFALALAEIGQN